MLSKHAFQSFPAGGANSTLASRTVHPNFLPAFVSRVFIAILPLIVTAFLFSEKLMSEFVDRLVFLLLLVFVALSPPVRCLGNEANGKERTLAMIKPDGVSGNYTEEIKRIIVEAGFNIVKERLTQLDKETASAFYDEHSSRSFFPDLVTYMTSGPVLVMVLEKRNAVSDWRGLIGPTDAQKAKISHPHSIRALCGKDSQRNCVHGSDSTSSAEREMMFFFQDVVTGDIATRHDEL